MSDAKEAYDHDDGDDTILETIHTRLEKGKCISRWEDFRAILRWKAGREREDFEGPQSEKKYLHWDKRQFPHLSEDTKNAFGLASEFLCNGQNADARLIESIKILDRFSGVNVRMATAILTFFNPREFTVMDYRAWKALVHIRWAGPTGPFEFWFEKSADYLPYLARCKELSRALGWKLRETDHALWKLEDIMREQREAQARSQC